MNRSCFLTGALGCIGAWVVKHVLDRGEDPVVFDLGDDMRRIKDLVEPEDLAALAPIDDVRASAAYRRDAAIVLVRRALAQLAEGSMEVAA